VPRAPRGKRVNDSSTTSSRERKRGQPRFKRHNAAVICVARRRCDLIHAMLTTATAYDPQRSENLAKAA